MSNNGAYRLGTGPFLSSKVKESISTIAAGSRALLVSGMSGVGAGTKYSSGSFSGLVPIIPGHRAGHGGILGQASETWPHILFRSECRPCRDE